MIRRTRGRRIVARPAALCMTGMCHVRRASERWGEADGRGGDLAGAMFKWTLRSRIVVASPSNPAQHRRQARRNRGWRECNVAEFDVLVPVEGMARIGGDVEQRMNLHRLWLEPDREAALAAPRAAHQGDRRDFAPRDRRRRADEPAAQSANRRELRRRLRPYRRRLGGRNTASSSPIRPAFSTTRSPTSRWR